MKDKIYRHLIFWLVSFIQGTVAEYAWIHTLFTKEQQIAVIARAACFNLAFMPSRLFFTYYALHLVTVKLSEKSYEVTQMVLKLILALFLAVTLHRLATAYYVIPHEFPNRTSYTWSELFSPFWVLISLLDLGYVAGLAVALKLFRMQAISQKNEKELVKDKLETELRFLKNQMNPHFLFNTLNAIYALARKKSDETPKVVVRLANLLRYMLYKSSDNTIPVSEEIRILENYVELERIRYGERLKVCCTKEIDDYSQLISPLILLPFIENAFKHGVDDTAAFTIIYIHATLFQGELNVVVKNKHNPHCNGKIQENIGLKNVKRQLELTYTDFSLNIANLEEAFLVNLKINLYSNGKL